MMKSFGGGGGASFLIGKKVPAPTCQSKICNLNSAILNVGEHRAGKVQARRRGGDGAVASGENSLIAGGVGGIRRTANIRRKGGLSAFRQQLMKVARR